MLSDRDFLRLALAGAASAAFLSFGLAVAVVAAEPPRAAAAAAAVASPLQLAEAASIQIARHP